MDTTRPTPAVIAVAAWLLACAGPAAAQDEPVAQPGDPRVTALLQLAGLVYEVDPDGEFRLLLEFDDGRSQQVFIRSETNSLEGLEVREIYSPGALGDTLAAAGTMDLLLRANHEAIMGAWEYQLMAGGDAALFCVRVPADPDAALLRRLVGTVGRMADDMEAAITGKDDL